MIFIICSRQREIPFLAMRSGNSVNRSSPGHTAMRSARIGPAVVSALPGSTDLTSVRRRNLAPNPVSIQLASRGKAQRLSTRLSCGLHNAPSIGVPDRIAPCSLRVSSAASSRHSRPISVRENASRTAMVSERCATTSRPLCSTRMPACGATSSQTSRDRRARREQSPACCPVTVTNPKLRTEAPMASASRSMTTTERPRRRATKACAKPMTPAPTTTRST